MKSVLKAVANLTDINIQQAMAQVRHNPLLDEEVNIEEELINLEEAIRAYRAAVETKTLQNYPSLKRHLLAECRSSLVHAIGLVARMLKGQKLPRQYTLEDTKYALQKIVRLVVADAQRTNRKLSPDFIEVTKPYMSVRQQLNFRKEHSLNPMGYARIARRSVTT